MESHTSPEFVTIPVILPKSYVSHIDESDYSSYISSVLCKCFSWKQSMECLQLPSTQEQTQEQSEISNSQMILNQMFSQQLDRIQNHLGELSVQGKETYDNVSVFTSKLLGSATKGVVGETFIESTLTQLFPDCTIQNQTQKGHSTDLHFIHPDTSIPPILVEVKFYNNAVPYKEVTKFYKDMERFDSSLGIFFSLHSSITKKRRFHIESYKGNLLLFIPNCHDTTTILIGMMTLLEMYKFTQQHSQLSISSQQIDKLCDTLYEQLPLFSTTIDQLHTFISNSNQSLQQMTNLIRTMDRNVQELNYKITEKLTTIRNSIQQSIQSIHSEPPTLPLLEMPTLQTYLQPFVDKKYALCAELRQLLQFFLLMPEEYEYSSMDIKNITIGHRDIPHCSCIIQIQSKKLKVTVQTIAKTTMKFEVITGQAELCIQQLEFLRTSQLL